MTDKTTKEYAEGLAEEIEFFQGGSWEELAQQISFASGYLRAIEECKVKELMEENIKLNDYIKTWETTMNQTIGEDGPKSVVQAIEKLKEQNERLSKVITMAENQYRKFASAHGTGDCAAYLELKDAKEILDKAKR